MARRRFAVALLIPPPAATEIDGLRRALGDRQLGKIDPHVTIVPPINVADVDVADLLAVVAGAARHREPVALCLGPVQTFGPESPVRFLAVDPWGPLVSIQDACWVGVMDRPRTRPFHPHVTIDISGSPVGGPDPALDVLAEYRVDVTVDRLTVLEHVAGPEHRQWETFNSYRFG